MAEVGRRVGVKREVAEKIRLEAIEEAKEINVLKRERAE